MIIHLVQGELVLDSGLRIAVRGRPPQGTKHDVLFGAVRGSGERVAVKLEGFAGALARESAALEYLTARAAPVPELIASGRTQVSGKQVTCLVMTRLNGDAPTTREGWRRMGRALGRLAEPVTAIDRLPVLDHQRIGVDHARRVHELGDRLTAIATTVPDWRSLAGAEMPHPGPLVLTHGDPGPGNFLDHVRGGSLIDWEDAHVAPRGLDLARVGFIARLGSGSAGFVGRDYDARARAATAGYLQAVPGHWQPSAEEIRWWSTVAGVKFIHHRWQREGRPAPWEQAAEVLLRLLTVSPSHPARQ